MRTGMNFYRKPQLVCFSWSVVLLGIFFPWSFLQGQDPVTGVPPLVTGQETDELWSPAAIQMMLERGERDLRIPSGNYVWQETLHIDLSRYGAVVLRGEGPVTIVMQGAGPAIRLQGSLASSADPDAIAEPVWQERASRIELLCIEGADDAADGIELVQTMQTTLSKVHVRKTRNAVILSKRNRNVVISDCHFYDNRGVGLLLNAVDLHQINVGNSHISYNREGGIVVLGGNVRNLHVTGCDIEANMPDDGTVTERANVLIDSRPAASSIAEVAITGCTIQHSAHYGPVKKAPGGANIRILGRSDFQPNMITISGNVISDTETHIHLREVTDTTITGNTFFTTEPSDIIAESCARILIANSVFNPRESQGTGRIHLHRSQDCLLNGLVCYNMQGADAAITLTQCERSRIGQCVMSGVHNGIRLTDSEHCVVSECSVQTLSGLGAAVIDEGDNNRILAVEFTPGAKSSTYPLGNPRADALSAMHWRNEKRIIDLHQHIEALPERFERAIGILDQVGVGVGVILGAGTVTGKEGEPSPFEKAKRLADSIYPGRFLHHMLLDYSGWDDADWSARAVAQIEEGHRLGASGLKEFKRLGLFLKDGEGKLIRIDDPKLDPVWAKCGELGMPVSIHVGDPKAFWLPYDETNERWTELKDHRSWWFGDPAVHPDRMELLAALNRVIERHPKTNFVCVHFANNPEELDWVDAALERYPNMYADLAARIPELGRHSPEKVRALFEKHQDRILFATDFMVYGKLILGSGGDADQPSDAEAIEFYRKCWRWMETDDRDWEHMTPIQGDWRISSIHLPPAVQRKIYFDNAWRLFGRSLPLPTVKAKRITRDFVPDGKLTEAEWEQATPVRLEYGTLDYKPNPSLSTPVRLLWSDEYLYLSFESPYEQLSVWEPAQSEERLGLWDYDVVEAFIGSNLDAVRQYTEFEWAPTGETLDLKLDLPAKDFAWTAGGESAVAVDAKEKIWRVEARLPLAALGAVKPAVGTRWRINLFRHDRSQRAFMAMSPTLQGSFHVPERFGWLEFVE